MIYWIKNADAKTSTKNKNALRQGKFLLCRHGFAVATVSAFAGYRCAE